MSPWILAVLAGCGGYTLSGSVQKGPYVLGSSVSVSTLNGSGEPTGQVFLGQTQNDAGEFSIPVEGQGLASIEGDGYFYNEVTGLLSESPLTLRSLSSLEREQPVRLNVITHLSYNRVLRLMREGADFETARSQAERELRDNLIIGPEGFEPGNGDELDLIAADDDNSAYLLAVSSVLSQAALSRAGDAQPVAALQELMNQISTDLSDDGVLSRELYAEINTAERMVNINFVEDALAQRLDEIGSSGVVPDLDRIFDTDNDGVVNANDNCALQANPGQETLPGLCHLSWTEFSLEDSYTLGMVTGDFNEDGFSDIVVSWYEQLIDGSIIEGYDFYAGDGVGNFTPVERQEVNRTCNSKAVDLDNDGYLDMVCKDSQSLDYVALGDGTGGFTDATALSPDDEIYVLSYDDLNKDGFTDILATNSSGGLILKYGTQGFVDISGYTVIDYFQDMPSPVRLINTEISDIDLDGLPEIVCTGLADYTPFIRVYSEDISGEFVRISPNIPSGFTEFDFVDTNEDSYHDIVISSPSWVRIYRNDTFGNYNEYSQTENAYYETTVLRGGLSDLFFTWNPSPVYEGSDILSGFISEIDDNFLFQPSPNFTFQSGPRWFGSTVYIGDIDSIGNEDVILMENSRKITIILINGSQ